MKQGLSQKPSPKKLGKIKRQSSRAYGYVAKPSTACREIFQTWGYQICCLMIFINYTSLVNSKFAVVGDTINMASQVESLTRTHNVELLITEIVKKKLDDRYALKEMKKPLPPTL